MQGVSGSRASKKCLCWQEKQLNNFWFPLHAGDDSSWDRYEGPTILWRVKKLSRRVIWEAFLGGGGRGGERRKGGGGAIGQWELGSLSSFPSLLPPPGSSLCSPSSPPPFPKDSVQRTRGREELRLKGKKGPWVTSRGESRERDGNERVGRRRWGELKGAAGKRRGGVALEAGA